MVNRNKISTCLVGFGNAGQGEYLRKRAGNSHFDLIQNNIEFNLSAVVDPRFAGMKLEHGNITVTPSISSLENRDFDLVVIAVSTNSHQAVCKEVSETLKPRAILLEKPAGSSLNVCQQIKKYLQEIPNVVINYQRNYNQSILHQVADTLSLGYPKGVVYYSNGAINNASHGIALLISVLGSPTNVFKSSNATRERSPNIDVDFVVEFGKTRISFIATKENYYSMFRMELFGSNGSWLYDAGLGRSEMRTRVEDPIYIGRFNLTENSTITALPDVDSFGHVYNYLEKLIHGDSDLEPNLGATLDLACEVHRVIEQVLK